MDSPVGQAVRDSGGMAVRCDGCLAARDSGGTAARYGGCLAAKGHMH